MAPKRARTAKKPATTTKAAPTSLQLDLVTSNSPDRSPGQAVDTPARSTRSRNATVDEVSRNDAYRMSGGLGASDVASESAPQEHAEKDAFVHDAAPVARPRNQRKPLRKIVKTTQTAAQKAAIEGLEKRMRAQEELATTTRPAATTSERIAQQGLSSVERLRKAREEKNAASSPSSTRQKTPQVEKPTSPATQAHATITAETPILALANFRRRPRQPSLLRMVQQEEAGDDTTDITLGNVEDDFAPHDESTPLQTDKQQGELLPSTQAPATNDDEDELYAVSPRPARTRKRKSDEMEEHSDVHVVRSSPSRSPSLSPAQSDAEDPTLEAALPVPSTLPEHPGQDDSEAREPESQSDTFADPMSSSPPPITHDENKSHDAARPKNAREPKMQPLTTAGLRALLPRRRIRRDASEAPSDDDPSRFGIPSSSENTLPVTRRRPDQQSYAPTGRRKPKATQGGKTTKKALATRRTEPNAKGKVAAKERATDKQPTAKPARTYGTERRLSDKENEASTSPLTSLESEDEDAATADTSLSPFAVSRSKRKGTSPLKSKELARELADARAKFLEVDAWEMEFDSASLGAGGDSSPWR